MPTQVVSNEEFEPRPQTEKQKQVEHLIGELSEERAKKLGMRRRDFMRSSMGLATCFLASNLAYGKNYWDVDEVETWEEMMIGWLDYTLDGQDLRTQGQSVSSK